MFITLQDSVYQRILKSVTIIVIDRATVFGSRLKSAAEIWSNKDVL